MSRQVFRASTALAAAAVLLLGGCSNTPLPSCTPVSGGATPFATLDAWCQVSLVNGEIVPQAAVTPYDLNTPLFSDYAVKRRTVWMPSGASATYDAENVLQFPEGTVFTKSFGFPDDLRKANPTIHWVETRVLWRSEGKWIGAAYSWDAAQTKATLNAGGGPVSVSWIDANGQTVGTVAYLVPGSTVCIQCHESYAVQQPIGPKARNLNRDFAYPDGSENQLSRWTRLGLLTGAPGPSAAPKLAVWNDPATGTLEERARAYLEGNCAHCHGPGGGADASALSLSILETNPTAYGVCKRPVAAGPGAGGRPYDINSGKPDDSIVTYRMQLTDPSFMMPKVGRSIVHTEGVQLITDWIASLSGSCP